MADDTRLRRLAWATWATSVVAAAVGSIITIRILGLDPTLVRVEVGYAVLAAAYSTVALLINRRIPTQRVGWLIAAAALTMALNALSSGYATASYLGPARLPGALWALWFVEWSWLPAFVGLLSFLPLLFPTGHPPSRGWRPVAWAAGTFMAAGIAIEALDQAPLQNHLLIAAEHGLRHENPVGVLPDSTHAEAVFISILAAVVTASVSALAWRFRRSRGDERQQIKWFAHGAAPIVGAVVLTSQFGHPLWTALILVFWTVPAVAVAIALLRYRLYDIDRIVSRTLAYALVTALLAGTYAGLVLLLGVVLRPIAADSDLAVAAAVLAVAVLFNPVRRRVQTAVDRRFNRARYDAQRTLVAFAERLRQEVDLDSLTAELTHVVGTTMQPARMSVWLREEARP